MNVPISRPPVTRPSGIALVTVLLLVLVLAVAGAVALKFSGSSLWMMGSRKEKKSLQFVAKTALEIVSVRMQRRMNPLRFYVDAAGTRQAKTVQDLIDEGHLFQSPADAQVKLGEYVKGFQDDSDAQTDVFEPCTADFPIPPDKSCAEAQGAEWRAKFLGWELLPPTTGVCMYSNCPTGEGDYVFRTRIEAVASELQSHKKDVATGRDDFTGRRAVVSRELLLVVPYRSLDSRFAMYGHTLSRMNFLNGFVKGIVGHDWDTRLAWGDASAGGVDPTRFGFGELGVVHPSCKRNDYVLSANDWVPGVSVAICNTVTRPLYPHLETTYQDQFMTLLGVLTTTTPSITYNKIVPHTAYDANTGGLLADDKDGDTPGLTDASVGTMYGSANDFVYNVDPTLLPTLPATYGRGLGGGVPETGLDPLAKMLNNINSSGGTTSTLRGSGAGCGPLKGIFKSEYKNSGASVFAPANAGGDWDSNVLTNKSPDSLILKPSSDCEIQIDGTFVVNGDVIIANTDGAKGHFSGKGAIYATGNIYVVGDVLLGQSPPSADWRDLTYNPSQDNDATTDVSPWDELSLVANGNVIIGNLSNSQNYSYLMTYANSEIPYFRVDANDDQDPNVDLSDPTVGRDNYDLLVPDGFRPSSSKYSGAETRADAGIPTTSYQVDRQQTCEDGGNRSEWRRTCNSSGVGLLPEGSQQIQGDAYRFYFDINVTNDLSGYGYVRNVTNNQPDRLGVIGLPGLDTRRARCWPNGATFSTLGVAGSICAGSVAAVTDWASDSPVGDSTSDLFQNGWIDTEDFRIIANMDGTAADNWVNDVVVPPTFSFAGLNKMHDSLVPEDVNRARDIFAKLYANGAVLGLGSFEDKYMLAGNPSLSLTAQLASDGPKVNWGSAIVWRGRAWDVALADPKVNNGGTPVQITLDGVAAGTKACSEQVSAGGGKALSIYGGVYARYVNILSTEGLCIYQDDRPARGIFQEILVIPSEGYYEDAVEASGVISSH